MLISTCGGTRPTTIPTKASSSTDSDSSDRRRRESIRPVRTARWRDRVCSSILDRARRTGAKWDAELSYRFPKSCSSTDGGTGMTKRQRIKQAFYPSGDRTFDQRRTANPKKERAASPESVLSDDTAGLSLLPLSSYIEDPILRNLAAGKQRAVITSIEGKSKEDRTAADSAFVATSILGPNMVEETLLSRVGKAAWKVGAWGLSTGASVLTGAGRLAYNYWNADVSKADLSMSGSEKPSAPASASALASAITDGSLPPDYATATLGPSSTIDERCAKLSSALPDYTPDYRRSFREEWTAHSVADQAWSQATRPDDDDAVLDFCAGRMEAMRQAYTDSLVSRTETLISAQPRVSTKGGSVTAWASEREDITDKLKLGVKGMKASSSIASGHWDEADMSIMSHLVENVSKLTQSSAYPSRKY